MARFGDVRQVDRTAAVCARVRCGRVVAFLVNGCTRSLLLAVLTRLSRTTCLVNGVRFAG